MLGQQLLRQSSAISHLMGAPVFRAKGVKEAEPGRGPPIVRRSKRTPIKSAS